MECFALQNSIKDVETERLCYIDMLVHMPFPVWIEYLRSCMKCSSVVPKCFAGNLDLDAFANSWIIFV